MSACFIVNFSRILGKHSLIVLQPNSVDDCSCWRFDGPWKTEGVFRLTSVEFSAMSFLLVLSAIMVTIPSAKMLRFLKIWKIDRDLIKVKYTFLHLCDAFLLEILTVMMKTPFALVIRLSLSFTHRTDKVRMNRMSTAVVQAVFCKSATYM